MALEGFVSTIVQSTAEVASRLELFRTQTLASFEPPDSKERETADAEMNGILDLMGPDNFQVPELPIVNSRAGLYIYLNAAVRDPLLSSLFMPQGNQD